MRKYKYCRTFLLTVSGPLFGNPVCDFVISGTITHSLGLGTFRCIPKKTSSCHYTECTGKINGYSKDVLVIVPEVADRLRVHFHGHYVKEPKKIVTSYNLQKSICTQREVVVFPTSTGKFFDTP